jgi:hypothetical protein
MIQPFGNKLKIIQMKQHKIDTTKLKEKISKGLDLTFQRLLQQKKAQNGTLIFSENGQIKRVKASDIR